MLELFSQSTFKFHIFTFVGESLTNDIALSCQSSAVLYAAAGSQVRIWDIRKFSSTGKLSGGHQAAVMCLAVGNTPLGGMTDSTEKVEFVVTGSKDHYVKVFEVRDGATGVLSPRYWNFCNNSLLYRLIFVLFLFLKIQFGPTALRWRSMSVVEWHVARVRITWRLYQIVGRRTGGASAVAVQRPSRLDLRSGPPASTSRHLRLPRRRPAFVVDRNLGICRRNARPLGLSQCDRFQFYQHIHRFQWQYGQHLEIALQCRQHLSRSGRSLLIYSTKYSAKNLFYIYYISGDVGLVTHTFSRSPCNNSYHNNKISKKKTRQICVTERCDPRFLSLSNNF